MRRLSTLLLIAPLAGCTAIQSTYHLVEAQQAVSRAENRRADELAVYEYTMAVRFLEKAQEEAGYSDYKVSVDLSRRSAEWADRAIIAIDSEGRDLQLSAVDRIPDWELPEAPDPTDEDLSAPLPETEAPPEDQALWQELDVDEDEDEEFMPDLLPEPEPTPQITPTEPAPAQPAPAAPAPAEPAPTEPAPPPKKVVIVRQAPPTPPAEPPADETDDDEGTDDDAPSFDVPPPAPSPWDPQ